MAHSSGIPVTKELDDAFSGARQSGNVRFLKIQIKEDSLVCTAQHKMSASLESDYRAMATYVVPRQPCYFVFRLEDAEEGSLAAASSSSQQKQRWLFVSYVPDDSPVKEKMLFGSTREACKKQLGFSFFKDEMQTSELSELTWEAYGAHTTSKCSAAPLTASEVQSHHETVAIVHHGHTKQYVHSVKFPMSAAAKDAVKKFKSGSLNLAQFEVDPVQETIELVATKTASASSLSGSISDETPGYSIYCYAHTHEGKSIKSNVFVYSCPDYSPIKLKMLHSTVKSTCIDALKDAGVSVDAKIEITEAKELTEALMNETLHPALVEVAKPAFSRPSRPGRGGARLTRRR
mmetsp:Transcript_38494/g.96860  ORF Transcript_38494/g.96860 Transcript_38494/m.96860 type:complete len:347 (+) Transcript_38494:77-1117(+)